MTGRVATGSQRRPGALSVPGDDLVEVRWPRLAVLWALALRRFRDYPARISGPERHREEDR